MHVLPSPDAVAAKAFGWITAVEGAGSAAEWVSAVGTLGAFFFGFILLKHERELRERKFADLIHAYVVESEEEDEAEGYGPVQRLKVHNASAGPVTRVLACVKLNSQTYNPQTGNVETNDYDEYLELDGLTDPNVLLPGQTYCILRVREHTNYAERYAEEPPLTNLRILGLVKYTFRDSAGIDWIKRSDGTTRKGRFEVPIQVGDNFHGPLYGPDW